MKLLSKEFRNERGRRHGMSAAALSIGLLVCSSGRAAFVNGVESFAGTVKDTATWQEHLLYAPYSAASQNGALTLAQGVFYETRQALVQKDSTVSVLITQSACYPPNDFFNSDLFLWERPYTGMWDEGFKAAIEYTCDPAHNSDCFWAGYSSDPDSMSYDNVTPGGIPLGTYAKPYRLELTCRSDNTILYRSFDADNDCIFSFEKAVLSVPDQFYLCLSVGPGGSTTFDSVTITLVPEPASLSLLLLAGGLFMLRRPVPR